MAARRAVSARPEDAALHVALAHALMMQNRNEEAIDVLQRVLARTNDPAARNLLAKLEREQGAADGMAQRGSSHFHLQFEAGGTTPSEGRAGGARASLRRLSQTFGFEPARRSRWSSIRTRSSRRSLPPRLGGRLLQPLRRPHPPSHPGPLRERDPAGGRGDARPRAGPRLRGLADTRPHSARHQRGPRPAPLRPPPRVPLRCKQAATRAG